MVDIKTIIEKCPDDMKEMIENLPINMQPIHVSDFLGICLSSAYKLIKSSEFPIIDMKGVKRLIIPKVSFLQWYFTKCI